jgi:hypothetical protein
MQVPRGRSLLSNIYTSSHMLDRPIQNMYCTRIHTTVLLSIKDLELPIQNMYSPRNHTTVLLSIK